MIIKHKLISVKPSKIHLDKINFFFQVRRFEEKKSVGNRIFEELIFHGKHDRNQQNTDHSKT